MGRQNAACILSNGARANIPVQDLSLLAEQPEPEIKKARTASMPFITGSTGSRSMNQTKSLVRQRHAPAAPVVKKKILIVLCDKCGQEFDQEERKGRPGKITECENCAVETESKVEGTMIFSHKTGATIEIKKDGELRHEAETFDPKNKA
jgi:hypothetical protein